MLKLQIIIADPIMTSQQRLRSFFRYDVDFTLIQHFILSRDPSAGALDEVPGPRDNNNPVPAGMRLTVWS